MNRKTSLSDNSSIGGGGGLGGIEGVKGVGGVVGVVGGGELEITL